MPEPAPDIRHWRSLMAMHRSTLSAPGRVGGIILEYRPALLLEDDRLSDVAPPKGFDGQDFSRMQDAVARMAGSVGRIEVEEQGWHNIATCFRVSTDPRRVVTARHVLRALLKSSESILCAPDAQPDATPPQSAYRPARVRFETAGGPDEVIDIEAVEWPHAVLDLALLRLAGDCTRPALELALPAGGDPLPAPEAAICVIGYPMQAPADPVSSGFGALFGATELGRKRVSPGRINPSQAHDPVMGMRHDATTLGGSSGSPVVALDSGKVIAVHACLKFGLNHAVLLPAALTEAELFRRMGDGSDPPDGGTAPHGSPDPPPYFGMPLHMQHGNGDELAATVPPALAMSNRAMPDRFDRRDRFYRPSLAALPGKMLPDMSRLGNARVQQDGFSCTGFALAAVIDRQLRELPGGDEAPASVSPAMLYGLATQHDEFVDDLPGGSSLRGAIKGFFHFGVCQEATAPYSGYDPEWHLTIEAAKQAREITLGAYYRLHPVLTDYQAALHEARAIVVSAHTHSGWEFRRRGPIETIPFKPGRTGAHAFAILGYDDHGFIIQNSWGPGWSNWCNCSGLARWTYADWAENIIDAWVIRLAPPVSGAFGLQVRQPAATAGDAPGLPSGYARLRDVRRSALVGHTIHAESTGLRGESRLGLGPEAIRETALHLASARGWQEYPGLALIFHDPTTDADPVARLAAHMIEPLKVNGIYPVHVHYGADEMRSLMVRMLYEAELAFALAAGSGERLNSYLDRRALGIAQPLFSAWLAGCDRAVEPGGGLWQAMAGLGLEAAQRGAAGRGDGQWRALHLLSIGAGWFPARAFIAARQAMGFGPCASVGAVAPPIHADPPAPAETRFRCWRLSAGKPADAVMRGYDGDWCDFLSRLSRSGDGPRVSGKGGVGADLGAAVTDAAVLNAVLAHMLGRRPAKTRSFQ
ncbi:trypsin-like peptidase domain-containing protein [Paracoccus lutimaris]|uniref:Trypsin-like peptidase n=1 Tax=Paracoccus lutimaris TaxID=1490030 RepID=A0A368Z5X9_9RHOB|nr:trypsin-like peptidase domain-containing protein [Paracoccus lutimaris]RCW85874.1 trypsin-like peptidase [Paracoccus lutimaris]